MGSRNFFPETNSLGDCTWSEMVAVRTAWWPYSLKLMKLQAGATKKWKKNSFRFSWHLTENLTLH